MSGEGDGSLALQKALVARLKDGATAAIAGDRVFDGVPPGAAKPYVSLGPEQVLADTADEYEGSAVRLQIDGWSAGPGRVEAKLLGRAIRTDLHQAPLELDDGQRLVLIEVEQTRYLREPDGLTQHAIVIVTARIEPV